MENKTIIFKTESKKSDWKIFKVSPYIFMVLLFLSYSFRDIYSTHSMFMLMPTFFNPSGTTSAPVRIDFIMYLFGGAVSYIIFELVSRFVFRAVSVKFPQLARTNFIHILRAFFIVCNIILGLFHILYFYYPLLINIGAVIDLGIKSAAAFGFFLYFSHINLDKHQYSPVLKQLTFIFAGINAVMLLINFFWGLI